MSKAIKHITAGPLHIEVIGKVPDKEPGRRRAARSRETCAAQAFYNLKSSWRELELWIAANFTARDLVVTFTFDEEHLPKNKKTAGDLFVQQFARKLRTARAKRGDDLKFIIAPEGFHDQQDNGFLDGDDALEDRRVHIHAVLNSTGINDYEELRSLWQWGGYIRIEKLDLHYLTELAKYMTKEAREFGRPKPGEHSWRRSRNLKPYDVEYIEIPSDSVTLAPPEGAVDYTQFAETNPYGFGQCIGARYLVFPRQQRETFSYNQGRAKRTPLNFNLETSLNNRKQTEKG